MRSVLLFTLAVAGTVMAQVASDPALTGPEMPRSTQMMPAHPVDANERMWRRAEIRVVPLELYLANKVELDSLRARVEQAQRDMAALEPAEPAARELLYRQQQLLRTLLSLAQRQETNAGKTPTAVEVQRHLNEIEGKVMCEACHAGIVARTR